MFIGYQTQFVDNVAFQGDTADFHPDGCLDGGDSGCGRDSNRDGITSGAETTSACTCSGVRPQAVEVLADGSVRGQADPHRRREASRSSEAARQPRLCGVSSGRRTGYTMPAIVLPELDAGMLQTAWPSTPVPACHEAPRTFLIAEPICWTRVRVKAGRSPSRSDAGRRPSPRSRAFLREAPIHFRGHLDVRHYAFCRLVSRKFSR